MELDRDNDRQTAGSAAPARRSLFRRDELARRNVDEAMTALRAELETNETQMRRQGAHLREVSDALQQQAKTYQGADRRCGEYDGWSGIGTPTFLDAAYQTAIATQALGKIDFHRGQDIAAAYAAQKNYENYYEKMLDFLLRLQPTPPGMCGGLAKELADYADVANKRFVNALAATQR